ncbi:acetyl-CoA acetyltransferase [Rhodococcoides kroppenstedtii]|uniref:acetyl-CoA acetyltransferase n=1 Tax=Rhodococcoides kroppenstedtii TaxID=293050 RepID=UPI00202DE1F7|nr:acetyl-CoA acetyltransferase [Rhodococcus kroppenstedtii]
MTGIDPRRLPVIVGVADLSRGSATRPPTPAEPLDLVDDAVHRALRDTGASGLADAVTRVDAVRTTSWRYDDLPGLLARRHGWTLRTSFTTTVGGHWPVALLNAVADGIADGSDDVALVVGGEAQASLRGLGKAGRDPVDAGWTAEPGGPPAFDPEDLGSAAMQRAGILAPVQIYPLFENARAHALGLTAERARAESAELYARFSAVSADHPAAWNSGARTADEIASVAADNRAVSDAYPLSMNAMPFVDQAAAVVVCSLQTAREKGVPEDRVVHVWGGAGAADTPDVVRRSSFEHSPALASVMERLGVAGPPALVDAYSCFPIVPKLLLAELQSIGAAEDLLPTLLGGHSFFGGPLSSYSLHGIAEAVRRLRRDRTAGPALVHANGGYLTHQHVVLLGAEPRPEGRVGDSDVVTIAPGAADVVTDHRGPVRVLTAATTYGRDGTPDATLLIAETADGRRVAGRTTASGAWPDALPLVGRTIEVTDENGVLAVRPA